MSLALGVLTEDSAGLVFGDEGAVLESGGCGGFSGEYISSAPPLDGEELFSTILVVDGRASISVLSPICILTAVKSCDNDPSPKLAIAISSSVMMEKRQSLNAASASITLRTTVLDLEGVLESLRAQDLSEAFDSLLILDSDERHDSTTSIS